MRVIYSFVVLAVIGIISTTAITTIHHDKPESVTISTIKTTTIAVSNSSTPLVPTNITVTLSPSERKKRLLPYQNFYFNQPFNRPHQAGVSAQQYKDYEDIDISNKKPDIEHISFRPEETLYQNGQKFTPFLDSNALPGPFRPMANPNNPNQPNIQYVIVDHPQAQEEEKGIRIKGQTPPDLSAIYEKLAQLKLRQQVMQQKTPYGYRLVPQHRFRERPQKLQEFRPNYDVPRYKIQPSKTTFETFTATNIDIPERAEEEKYDQPDPPRYHQMPTPTKDEKPIPVHTKYRENTKPFVQHQIAIEIPQSSLPLIFNPSVVRKPTNSVKDRPRTYILIQQGKPSPKQPTFVLRKPKPSTVVDESYVAEKFVPVVHPKTHHYRPHRPLYIPQELHYPEAPNPVYQNSYEAQYQVTPAPVEHYQQEYQALDAPNYQKLNYGEKSTPPENIPVPVVTSEPSISYQSGPGYYHYQTVTQGPSTVSSVATYSPPKIFPQYQNQLKYEEDYRETSDSPKLEDTSTKGSSLADILKQLQESNTLPQTLTSDNIDNSIKTLVKILNALKDRQKQHKPVIVQDEYEYDNEAGVDLGGDVLDTPDGGTPGKPGVDYPALSSIPKTTFTCKTQRYKGFFGDPDTNCQVWHYCDLNGGQASFLCPNGTIFSQVALTCDWWYNVKCSSTAQLYVLNERLYKYIIPLSPKFPEDYSGPLVDKYLAMKFQEMEEKLKKQKKGKGNTDSKESEDSSESDDTENDEDGDSSKEESKVIEETEQSTTEANYTVETTTT